MFVGEFCDVYKILCYGTDFLLNFISFAWNRCRQWHCIKVSELEKTFNFWVLHLLQLQIVELNGFNVATFGTCLDINTPAKFKTVSIFLFGLLASSLQDLISPMFLELLKQLCNFATVFIYSVFLYKLQIALLQELYNFCDKTIL